MTQNKKVGRKKIEYNQKSLQKKVPSDIYKECMKWLNEQVIKYKLNNK
jgi:hypothetical protein